MVQGVIVAPDGFLNVIDGMGTIEEVSSNISMIIKRDFKVD